MEETGRESEARRAAPAHWVCWTLINWRRGEGEMGQARDLGDVTMASLWCRRLLGLGCSLIGIGMSWGGVGQFDQFMGGVEEN